MATTIATDESSKKATTTTETTTIADNNANILSMIEACTKGDKAKVKSLIDTNKLYACQQNKETGQSPLMAAASKGHEDICNMLLEAGAPWNAIDRSGNCAGNYATDAEHWDVVNLLVDAGTKAELILGASIRLQKQLSEPQEPSKLESQQKDEQHDKQQIESSLQEEPGNNKHKKTTTVETTTSSPSRPVGHEPCSKPDYIHKHRVRFNADKSAILDDDDDAIMMEWERPLMDAHASILMNQNESEQQQPQQHKIKKNRVMNIGFGMGIIDTALQKLNPALHIIVEAHPDVYKKMLEDKWDTKPNVRICFGRWQDEIPKLIKEGVQVDGIFYDTYAENFMDLEDFHQMTLPHVLSKPNGIYSFFNGLAPDNLFFHGVACQCVKLQLGHLGLETEFLQCQIQVADSVWEGVRRKYWHGRDTYYLPVSKWATLATDGQKKEEDHNLKRNSPPEGAQSDTAAKDDDETSLKRAKTN